MTLTRKQTRKLLLREIKKEQTKRKKYVKLCDHVLTENKKLIVNKKYYTQQEINEDIMSTLMSAGGSLLGNLLPGLISDVKQKIATTLLRNLGLNPKSKFGRIVVNVFEEFQYTEIMEYFSDWKTGCPKFIDTFLRALSDALIEGLIEDFLGAPGADEQSGIAGTFRETLTKTLDDQLIPKIAPKISKFICNMNMGGIITKIKDVASGKTTMKDAFADIGKSTSKPADKVADTAADIAAKKPSALAGKF
jgi:hypothetical protein